MNFFVQKINSAKINSSRFSEMANKAWPQNYHQTHSVRRAECLNLLWVHLGCATWGPCLQSWLSPHHSLPITSLGLPCFPSKLDLHISNPTDTYIKKKTKDPEVTVFNPVFIFTKHTFKLSHLIGAGTLYVLSHLALLQIFPFWR